MSSNDFHPNGKHPDVRGADRQVTRPKGPTRPLRRRPSGPERAFNIAAPIFAGLAVDAAVGTLFYGLIDKGLFHGAIEKVLYPQFEPFLEIAATGFFPGIYAFGLMRRLVRR